MTLTTITTITTITVTTTITITTTTSNNNNNDLLWIECIQLDVLLAKYGIRLVEFPLHFLEVLDFAIDSQQNLDRLILDLEKAEEVVAVGGCVRRGGLLTVI